MRGSLRVITVLCAFLLAAPAAHAQRAIALRVLQWNVLHSGSGSDGVRDRERQVAWIVAQSPEIVTLNEVTAAAARDYQGLLEDATGVRWFVHHVAAVAGSDGNTILSQYPIRATGGRVLTRARSVTYAAIDVNAIRVNVFATHLESGDHAADRAQQAGRLLEYVAMFPAPRIVNGDLNADPDAGEIRPLLEAYRDSWEEVRARGEARSYPDNPPDRYTRTRRARIDYILVSREGALHPTRCEVPDLRDPGDVNVIVLVGTSDDKGVRPSDHNLVSCMFDLRAMKAPANAPAVIDPPRPAPPSPIPPIASGAPAMTRPAKLPIDPASANIEEVATDYPAPFDKYRWTWAWWYARVP